MTPTDARLRIVGELSHSQDWTGDMQALTEIERAAFKRGAEALRAALIADAERLGLGVTERFLRDSVLPEMPK